MDKIILRWEVFVRLVDRVAIDSLASLVPWLAPIVPAFIAWTHMRSILGFPSWVAFIDG